MVSWLRRWWPLVVVALAVTWLFGAPLVGRVWFFEDIAAYFVPLYTAARAAMRHGDFPLWELGAWSGQPLVGDPQLGLFYPINWLWMIVAPMRLYAWLQLFHVALGAGGMWALAKARGRSTAACALAALTLGCGAFMVLELRHAMFVATTAWLPWVLWGVERLAQRRTVDDALWIAIALALGLLAGGWSMLAWGALVVGVYMAAAIARAGSRRARLTLTAALAGATLLALALAMVQIVPALAHARLSPRALGTTPEFASSYAWPSWRYALTLFAPTLYGDVARGTYVGAPDQWELCGYGIGVAGGLLALASLRVRERRRERVALLFLTVVACVIARGWAQPILRHLPLYGSLRCPARALYVWTLAAPILAADGLDALAHAIATSTRASSRATLVRAIAVVVVALELVVTFRGDNPSQTPAAAAQHPQAFDWLRAYALRGRATNDVHLGNDAHNAGMRFRFQSAGGYHSLPIWRYLNLLWIANHGAPYPRAQLGDDLTGQGLWRFSSPIVNLLSVAWVAAPRDRPIDVPGWKRVFAGDDGVDVWYNPHAFPRALIIHGAVRVADEAAAARAVAAATWNPATTVIVEEDVGVPPPLPERPLPPTQPYEYTRVAPTSATLDVSLERAGVLVMAEPWYPGWRVTVDGAPAESLRVDYALRGVRLPAGRHAVAWELSCPPLQAGAAVSLLALLAAAVITGVDARRRRRARRGA
ncbi:MAG TPA: hypothetical protein VGL86_24280 [Polyangia bacterium]